MNLRATDMRFQMATCSAHAPTKSHCQIHILTFETRRLGNRTRIIGDCYRLQENLVLRCLRLLIDNTIKISKSCMIWLEG